MSEMILAIDSSLYSDIGNLIKSGPEFRKMNCIVSKFSDANIFDRDTIEKDELFKQIIPYILVEIDGKYLTYCRTKTNESRLQDMHSIGFGGHINRDDITCLPKDKDILISSMVNNCIDRELDEELIRVGDYTDIRDYYQYREDLGLIYSERDHVSKCHIGLVYIQHFKPNLKDDLHLTGSEFYSLEELTDKEMYDSMETWSKLTIEYLAERHKQGKE